MSSWDAFTGNEVFENVSLLLFDVFNKLKHSLLIRTVSLQYCSLRKISPRISIDNAMSTCVHSLTTCIVTLVSILISYKYISYNRVSSYNRIIFQFYHKSFRCLNRLIPSTAYIRQCTHCINVFITVAMVDVKADHT